MNSIVIDTNAYVAFLNGNKLCVNYIRSADEIILPSIVLGEIYYGIFRGTKKAENTKNLDGFLASPRVSIMHSDDKTAVSFGEIAAELANAGKPMQQNDIWIAALCKDLGKPLLTYDKGFENIIGLKLLPVTS